MSSNHLLLRFALKFPWLIIATIILGFSGALFNGASTALVVPLLATFVGQETLQFKGGPPILHKLISLFDGFTGSNRIIVMVGLVLLTIILKNAANYANTLVSTHLSRSLTNGMRLEGIQLLLEVDLDFFSKYKIGDITNRVSSEVNRAAGSLRTYINMVSTIITISVFVWFLISLSWQLTIIATLLLGVVAFANQYFIKRAKVFGKILSEKSKEQTNKLLEILTGIRLIKTVGNEDYEYHLLRGHILAREKAEFDSQANSAIIGPINEIAGILVILSMVVSGRYIFAEQLEAFSTVLLTYLIFMFRLLPFVSQLNNARSSLANVSHSTGVITDFLRRDNKPLMVKGSDPYRNLQKGIQFESVSFAYPNHEDIVLKGIDLWIPKGQTVALVGASGAGKSTIADLLPRFYDPTGGKITLDGKDIKEYELKSLRKAMGVVSQDTFLFNNSIAYNIAYGCENATETEIIEAAKRANAYEFIIQLSKQFETEIGDRGVMLSGGQRQRLAIARALLRNPDILILDEATSALDTVSERLVQEAIEELCRDRTTLVIAHRLSTVQKANQIVVLDKGRVVEIGTHLELLDKGGYYSRLYAMQFTDKPQAKIVLPTNEALLRSSLKASHELRTRLSYEVRSRLNGMLGSLRLLSDGLVDDEEEKQELIEESCASAMQLLNTMELFEENSHRSVI